MTRIVITMKGMTKSLMLTPMQRECLRFHLDSARRFPYGSPRRVLHLHVARSVAGMEIE